MQSKEFQDVALKEEVNTMNVTIEADKCDNQGETNGAEQTRLLRSVLKGQAIGQEVSFDLTPPP